MDQLCVYFKGCSRSGNMHLVRETHWFNIHKPPGSVLSVVARGVREAQTRLGQGSASPGRIRRHTDYNTPTAPSRNSFHVLPR